MKNILAITLTLFFVISAVGTSASELWRINGLEDVLKGDAKGVSISSEGTIKPAPAKTTLLESGERLAWSAVSDAKGNIFVGTGGSGKLFVIDAARKTRVLSTLPEANVTALAVSANNELFAATSPDGKVYRIADDGSFSVHFEPTEKYIWSMVSMPDGSLAVATGDGGRIYKVQGSGATREKSLLFDSPETNITTLALGGNGTLYAGTDPNGLVIGIDPMGRAFAVLDSPLREIRDITIDGDSVFVLAVAEGIGANTSDEAEKKIQTSVQVVKAKSSDIPTKSRNDTSASKSIVYLIKAGGAQEIVWNSSAISAFSILPNRNGEVLVGTSDKGRIFSVDREAKQSLLVQTDELHVSKMIRSGTSVIALSGSGAKAVSIGPEEEINPSYLSPILDSRNVSLWGRLSWSGNGASVIEARSGNVEQPDGTWSDWKTVSTANGKAGLSNARFFQLRATLRKGASIGEMSVAFAQLNVAPEVVSLDVLPTNIGLAPNIQIPTDPNIEASGMDPALFGLPSGVMPPRKLYQRGAVSMQWNAEDRNGDRLVFDVLVRRIDESVFRPVRRDITESFATIDGLTLADGLYIFKVVAKDAASNPVGSDLSGSLTTGPVLIDNSAPTASQSGGFEMTGGIASVRFDAVDIGGRINRAEYSVNGGEWKTVVSDDGVNDDSSERFTVRFPAEQPGQYSLVFRVYDSLGNSGSVRVVIERR